MSAAATFSDDDLRAYQRKAIECARDAYRKGARRILIVLPCGAGKTHVGSAMVRNAVARGLKVLWLAHRRELVKQAAARLEAFGLTVGHSGLRTSACVQVRTVQGILAKGEAPEADLIICDEAHHFVEGNDWRRVIDAYPNAMVIGLTATPERADGKGLGGEGGFQALVVAAQVHELQAEGFLCKDIAIERAPRALKAGEIAQEPVDAYQRWASGELAVVFAQHLKDAARMLEGFIKRGIRAALVTGKTPKDERARMLEQWQRGDIRVVVNCNVLTEGFDFPELSCCIIARGCSSAGQLIQMANRAFRPHPSKSRAILIDLRGVTWLHGRPDADCDYSLDDVGIKFKAAPTGLRFCKVCGALLGEGPCGECGKDGSLKLSKALGLELQSWDERYQAAKEKIKPSRAALCLVGILRKASAAAKEGRVWKPRAVGLRFQAIMKRWPTHEEEMQAEAILRETGT